MAFYRDVWGMILSNLPEISLGNFRLVCKGMRDAVDYMIDIRVNSFETSDEYFNEVKNEAFGQFELRKKCENCNGHHGKHQEFPPTVKKLIALCAMQMPFTFRKMYVQKYPAITEGRKGSNFAIFLGVCMMDSSSYFRFPLQELDISNKLTPQCIQQGLILACEKGNSLTAITLISEVGLDIKSGAIAAYKNGHFDLLCILLDFNSGVSSNALYDIGKSICKDESKECFAKIAMSTLCDNEDLKFSYLKFIFDNCINRGSFDFISHVLSFSTKEFVNYVDGKKDDDYRVLQQDDKFIFSSDRLNAQCVFGFANEH